MASPTAVAADGDRVDSFRIEYRVAPDGVLHVTERIVYRFGSPGRHGIYRDLLVREPYVEDTSKDQRYDVSRITVSSPSADSSVIKQEDIDVNGDRRTKVLRLRIGSPDRTVAGPTATYEIKYEVRGGLRHFADHSELYWDATGSGWEAELHDVGVVTEAPGGVTNAACFAGPPGSRSPCATASVDDGRGTFHQPVIRRGEELTVVAAILPGQVPNDLPLIEPAAPPPTSDSGGALIGIAVVVGVISLGSLLMVGVLRMTGSSDASGSSGGSGGTSGFSGGSAGGGGGGGGGGSW